MQTQFETTEYQNALNAAKKLLQESNIDNKLHASIYQSIEKLFSLTGSFKLQLWQLQALSGDTFFYPSICDLKDGRNRNLAHYAAFSNQPRALDWIKANQPELLVTKNKHGFGMIYYIAYSGDPAMLKWVSHHDSSMFLMKTRLGNDFTFYAARSQNEQQFNCALQLSKHPQAFHLRGTNQQQNRFIGILQCIEKALDSNFCLLDVKIPGFPENTPQINSKLQRNQQILTLMYPLVILLRHGEDSILHKLSLELLFCIFEKMLPNGVPSTIAFKLFRSAIDYTRQSQLPMLLHPLQSQVFKLLEQGLSKLSYGYFDELEKTRLLNILAKFKNKMIGPSDLTKPQLDRWTLINQYALNSQWHLVEKLMNLVNDYPQQRLLERR